MPVFYMENRMLKVKNLKKYFPLTKSLFGKTTHFVKAVDDVSFDIGVQDTLGLVGESGSGKTTVGRTLLKLIEPTAGSVFFNDVNLFKLNDSQWKSYRKKLQIIFQDPYSSLNPRMTVGDIISEGMIIHKVFNKTKRLERTKELLNIVGLPQSYITRYPHEFSGGQRQRIGIARAISLNPDFIVCDEAVSALDVSIQAQIINLLMDLQEKFNLSYLFISHDLSVVKHISSNIAVMYAGEIVEQAKTDDLFTEPLHPYTQKLLSAIPSIYEKKRKRIVEDEDIINNNTKGCPFFDRCPKRTSLCKESKPEFKTINDNHKVKCFNI